VKRVNEHARKAQIASSSLAWTLREALTKHIFGD
jgi:hypothetical protein